MVSEVYEGALKLYLLKDIFNNNYQEKIAAIIDKCLSIDELKRVFHEERKLKGYVFNGFFSSEQNTKNKDTKYSAGNVYTVRIRSLDKNLMTYFKTNLKQMRTEEMQALAFDFRVLPTKTITKIYSITPAVSKFEDGYWQNSHSIEDIAKKIELNARSKMKNLLFKEPPSDIDFIKCIKRLNSYPIVREYNRKMNSGTENKKIKLLCDKFELEIQPNAEAQNLARVIVGAGMLEMNARGFGYVNVKTI